MSADVAIRQLSLAVQPRKAWRPQDRVRQLLRITATSPTARLEAFGPTPSGVYVFVGMPPGVYDVRVTSRLADAGSFLDAGLPGVNIPHANPAAPVESVDLLPHPGYPFAPSSTLLRGLVTRGGAPVGGATIEVQGQPDTTRTTDKGEFVLPFDDYQPSGPINLDVIYDPAQPPHSVAAAVEAHETRSTGVIAIP